MFPMDAILSGYSWRGGISLPGDGPQAQCRESRKTHTASSCEAIPTRVE